MKRAGRFAPEAAEALARAIREAGGVEVFAIGDTEDGIVTSVTIACRGQEHRVTALIDRPRAGQVVIHNHPSGDLRPSDADMHLAGMYAEDGVGVVIVDSAVTRANWVVEPHVQKQVPVDPEDVARFFRDDLARAMPGFEPRPQQLEMAAKVAESLSRGTPVVVEAGTGTGKSLAYLVPAALWALANDARVMVSTHTKALQAQLLRSDLPMLARAGLEVRTAVLQGRNNYLCKRRLGLALDEEEGRDDEDAHALRSLAEWEGTSVDGSRTDLPFEVPGRVWDRVLSDSDLSLRHRCAHFASCHYHSARRAAAGAHLVVVNHALLLSDLALRAQYGRGVLPNATRVVLDEAHHLEDSATGAATEHLSATAVRRAILPLLDRGRRRGALARLLDRHAGPASRLPAVARGQLVDRIPEIGAGLDALARAVPDVAAQLAELGLDENDTPLRVTVEVEEGAHWHEDIVPLVTHLASEIEGVVDQLTTLDGLFDDVELDEAGTEPLLDVRRARRRLAAHAAVARRFLEPDEAVCRWFERDRTRRNERLASLAVAPIDVARTLRNILWEPLPGTVSTSATLSVAGRFDWWLHRTGLRDAPTAIFPSPFDHFSQCLLGLPRDLPSPEHPRFLAESARSVARAVELSDGGAFVLCTSYASVKAYAEALRARGGRAVLAQGEAGRAALLERFLQDRRAVLVGTDSFWEGVSVKGEGLRLVVIPRLPFRVPTEPLRLARQERLEARGIDPFRAQALPETAIKLRQGFGRLIRSHSDRGVVLLLDRRIHERRYGPLLLRALPPARRIVGPWRRVEEEVGAFFGR